MKTAGLDGKMYDFFVGYENIDADDVIDIHKYVMKKHNIE